jgi:glycosyltransferase involved in cell wall biosynthesis
MEEARTAAFIGNLNNNISYNKFLTLADEIDNLVIHIIGDGTQKKKFNEKIQHNELDNIHLHGYLPDEEAYKLISNSQICVLPLKDTHHTRVAQHMKGFDYCAMGKPITTDRDGTAQILEKHNAALVSDPGDPNQFVNNVSRLLNSRQLREEVSTNAEGIIDKFTWKEQTQKIISILESRESSKYD